MSQLKTTNAGADNTPPPVSPRGRADAERIVADTANFLLLNALHGLVNDDAFSDKSILRKGIYDTLNLDKHGPDPKIKQACRTLQKHMGRITRDVWAIYHEQIPNDEDTQPLLEENEEDPTERFKREFQQLEINIYSRQAIKSNVGGAVLLVLGISSLGAGITAIMIATGTITVPLIAGVLATYAISNAVLLGIGSALSGLGVVLAASTGFLFDNAKKHSALATELTESLAPEPAVQPN